MTVNHLKTFAVANDKEIRAMKTAWNQYNIENKKIKTKQCFAKQGTAS